MKNLIGFFAFLTLTQVSFPQSTSDSNCGARFTANSTSQVLSTPNYPRDHGNNLRCTWTITTEETKNIMLVITDLDTEPCCDYVEVYDDMKKVGRYKGRSQISIPIISFGNQLEVRFRSDSSVARSGFLATFVETFNCGSPVVALESPHYITTPFFPKPHPPNIDCFWTITAQESSKKVEITFTDGYLDECCDEIQIFDEANRIAKIKGNFSKTQKYYSKGQQLSVYFHSSETFTRSGTGFVAQYQEYKCGGSFDLSITGEGSLASPNFPNVTEHNLDCIYNLLAEPGYLIEVQISVQTEACCDYVQVSEGKRTLGTLKGSVPKSTIVSSGSRLRLLFHTDSSVESKGFNATFKQILPRCGRIYTAKSVYQDIISPGYPNLYPNNYQCDWIINSATADQKIVLMIVDLVTEKCCDYVEIFDGLASIGKFQGVITSPLSFVTQTSSLRLRLFTDDNTPKKGFRARFKLAQNCGSMLNAGSSELTFSTPNYPNDHADNLDCMWTIQSEFNTQVQINITGGETELQADYIQILDGLKPLARLSGVLTPQVFTSTGTIMRVFFHSDDSVTQDGFRATYKEVCNTYINVTRSVDSYLTSPGYPSSSPHNYHCHVILRAPVGQRIRLDILRYNTEACCDFIRILDGSTVLHTYRGASNQITTPPVHFSSGTEMTVFYNTDSSVGSRGFQFTYRLAAP